MSRGPAATEPAEIAALRALTVRTIKSHLTRLIASGEIEVHLDLPGNRLEALKGDRKGQYSVRINDQWRICFEWPKGARGPSNVEIVDYH